MKLIVAALAGLTISGLASVAQAQGQAHELVDSKEDWSIFKAGEGDGAVCWIASKPTQSTALRGGKAVEVRRGDIYLMVSFRPEDGAENEVSFIAGYPFKEDSTVKVEVGDDEWEMFTVGEAAWLSSSEKDDRIVKAFKGGADAKVTGLSSRGTTTIDTFSLMGFTDAVERAAELCS